MARRVSLPPGSARLRWEQARRDRQRWQAIPRHEQHLIMRVLNGAPVERQLTLDDEWRRAA